MKIDGTRKRGNNTPMEATTKLNQCQPSEPKEHLRLLLMGRKPVASLSCCSCVVTLAFSLSSAIHEFPGDIFTNQERKSGAVLLHIMAVRDLFLNIYIQYIYIFKEAALASPITGP